MGSLHRLLGVSVRLVRISVSSALCLSLQLLHSFFLLRDGFVRPPERRGRLFDTCLQDAARLALFFSAPIQLAYSLGLLDACTERGHLLAQFEQLRL